MKNIYNTTMLKFTLQLLDILTINIIFAAFFYVMPTIFNDLSKDNILNYFLLGNLSYIIGLCFVRIVHHSRIVRQDVIISCVARTLGVQFLIFLSLLSIFHVTAPDVWMLALFYVVALVVISSERILVNKYLKRIRFCLSKTRKVVLVGCGDNIFDIAKVLQNPWSGHTCIGIFADAEENNLPQGIKLLGCIADALPWLEKNRVDDVYCGLPSKRACEIMPIINHCESSMIRYYSVPNFQTYLKRKMVVKKIDGTLVLAIRDEPLGKIFNRVIKRSFDIAVSSLFLFTVYPFVYIILGTLIKFSSNGPVYFKQKRTGVDGKTFECLKFRSMKVNSNSDKIQATENDDRKTKIGNFMRKTNLDELPQFINVLKGEMSIVGPRPHMLKHTEEYSQLIKNYMVRHLIKPGITGWAQVRGYRGETKKLSEMEKRVRCDIRYLENWSVWLDLDIMIRTVTNMIKGEKRAY